MLKWSNPRTRLEHGQRQYQNNCKIVNSYSRAWGRKTMSTIFGLGSPKWVSSYFQENVKDEMIIARYASQTTKMKSGRAQDRRKRFCRISKRRLKKKWTLPDTLAKPRKWSLEGPRLIKICFVVIFKKRFKKKWLLPGTPAKPRKWSLEGPTLA